MYHRLLLTSVLLLAATAPAMAQEDDYGLGEDAPPRIQMPDTSQFKNMDIKPSGLGITDMASAMKLIKIGQALKARKPVSAADMTFVRNYLKKMGASGGSNAEMMQKLDQVLDQLQQRQANPTEMDELMREMGDGADMDDLPSLDD